MIRQVKINDKLTLIQQLSVVSTWICETGILLSSATGTTEYVVIGENPISAKH